MVIEVRVIIALFVPHVPLSDELIMKAFLRYVVLCALPILFAAGAGRYFTTIQGSCGAMVGALFSGKCAGRQREYHARFQLGGAGVGLVLAATLGAWLEHRRRRAVQPTTAEQPTTSAGEPS